MSCARKMLLVLMAAVLMMGSSALAEGVNVQEVMAQAEQGDDSAMFHLGYYYMDGQGVEQNYAKSMEWYLKAAEKGNADAMSNIGWLYEYGYGVEKDALKAIEWYQKGAEGGNGTAAYYIGQI